MAYDAYVAHEWQHGEVITSQLLNALERAVEDGSAVTKDLNELQYDENLLPDGTIDDGSYDTAHGTETNKIATKRSVARDITHAIDLLDVESLSAYDSDTQISDVDDNTYENETGYQRIITQIAQVDGKIDSLKYKVLPIATKFEAGQDVNGGTLGLVRIGNDLTITPQGGLSGDYKIDNLWNIDVNNNNKPNVAYNNVEKIAQDQDNPAYNPLTTVNSVTYRIKNLIGNAVTLPEVAIDQNNNYAGTRLAVTGLTTNTLNGTVVINRSPISIPIEQVNDIYITGAKNANGQANEGKYTIPTLSTVNTAIETAINNLNVTNDDQDTDYITGFGAGKTLSALTESNGKIGATFQDISIIKSQVSDLETLRSLTAEEIEDRDDAIEGNEEWVDPRENEGLLSTSDYDTFIELVQPMESWDGSGTDTRPAGGLITPTDKDNLDTLFAKNDLLVTMTSAPVSGTDEREDAGLISKTDKDALDALYAKNNYLVAMDSKPVGTDTRLASGLFKKDDKDALDTLLNNITIDSNGNIVGIKISNAEGTAYKTLTYSGLVEPEPEPQEGE